MNGHVPVPGSQKSLLPSSRPAGPVNPSELASLTVRVRSTGDPKALEQHVYEQAAQPLAKRQYLTHEQLAEQHGASKEDLDKIEAFAQQHDLFVVSRNAAARTIQLQGKLADLYASLNAARAYVYTVARACDARTAVRRDAAACILFAAERATQAALEAIQALGGNGYINDYPAGRLLRDAKLYEIGAGTQEIRRMLIGRELFEEAS